MNHLNNKMPETLYIIGNGFDRYHGLDTRYHSFAFFMQNNALKIYELFLKYYGLPDLNPKDKDSYKDPLWAEFESALANLDFQTVLDDNTNYLANPSSADFRDRDWHAYQIEMEMVVDNLTKELWELFKKFILAVEFPEEVDNKFLGLESNSIFLNFNYTDTLERYYYLRNQRILYIHGKAKLQNEKIILGHGRNPETFIEKKTTPPEGLSKEELEQWEEEMSNRFDYSYEAGKAQLMSYFSDSFKSTKEIIERNEVFFKSLNDIQKVIVLGHSISEVDQPYFSKVIQSIRVKNISWMVSYYSEEEYSSHLQRLTALGIEKEAIQLVKMETLKRKEPTLF